MASGNTDWLDERYVQKVLRDSKKDESIVVTKVTRKPATSIGDNYLSDMTRVAVVFSRIQDGERIGDDASLILKVVPQHGMRHDMVAGGSFFNTEMSMMSNTLPKMTEILKEVTTPKLAAQCFELTIFSIAVPGLPLENPQLQFDYPAHLIIEDLKPEGFRMFEHNTGLDLEHCLLAIRNLALFHASSVALKEKDPDAVVNYNKGILYDHSSVLPTFFTASTKTLGHHVSQWTELHQHQRISEKLIKLSEVVVEKGRKATEFREDDFNVLNHGDFWVNNMMFRYDEEGKPIAHIFVDFQLSYYGSPALDLLYFMSLNPSDYVRLNHRELLLREYYALLTSTMIKLKCSTEVPTLDQIKKMMKERGPFLLGSCFGILPVILCKKNEAPILEEIISPEGEVQHPGFKEPLYRKIMMRALKEYDSMGLLDV